jgi:hypothetical protein
MIKRHYFLAVRLKGSDFYASGTVMTVGFFRSDAEVVFEGAKRSLSEHLGIKTSEFIPIAFNQI